MKKFAQRYVHAYYRIRNNRVERVKGHWWPSNRYLRGRHTNRRVKAWLRRRRRK